MSAGAGEAPGAASHLSLLRPESYECANCGGHFEARNRPTPYCTLQCGAEAKTVRYARKARTEHGDDLPDAVRDHESRVVRSDVHRRALRGAEFRQ